MPTRDEVREKWKTLNKVETRKLYFIWAEHVVCMGGSRSAYWVLVGRREGRRPLGRPRRKWEDSIKMELRKM